MATGTEQRRAAQNVVEDFTRNIQRKKDKEMAELQFVGGGGNGDREEAGRLAKEGRPQRSMPLRQRKEVQEMLRNLVLAFIAISSACAAGAAIWPEHLGKYDRKSVAEMSGLGRR